MRFHVNPLPSIGFTSNIKSCFLWKTMKKYSRLSSAVVVIGDLRGNRIWNYIYYRLYRANIEYLFGYYGDDRVVRWCRVTFQCRGVLLIWIRVGKGLLRLQKVRVGVVWTFFSRLFFLFSLSLPLRDGPITTAILSQRAVKTKPTNQPKSGMMQFLEQLTRTNYLGRSVSFPIFIRKIETIK